MIVLNMKFRNYEEFKELRTHIKNILETYISPEKMMFEVAIIEAVNNAIIHGNNSINNYISLTIKIINEKKIIIRVKDKGKGFDVRKKLRKLNNHGSDANKVLNESGRGIIIMTQISDYIRYNKKGNEVLLVCNINKNSSSLKRSNEEMDNSIPDLNDFYKDIIYKLPDSIVVLDKNGIIRFAKFITEFRAERKLGLTEEKLIGKHFRDIEILNDKTIKILSDKFNRAIKGKYVDIYEIEVNNWAKDQLFYEISSSILIKNNKVEFICASLRDITEKKKTEKELKSLLKDNQFFKDIFDKTDVGILIVDIQDNDTSISYANKGYSRMTGYSIEELLDEETGYLKDNTRREVIDKYIINNKNNRSKTIHLLDHKQNNESYWRELTLIPFRDENGDLVRFTSFSKDITKRKKLELKLREDINLAKSIQIGLLKNPLFNDVISIQGKFIPSDNLSGDLYAYYKIDDNKYGILIMDVMGHGIAAALITIAIRSLLRGIIHHHITPMGVIETLDLRMKDLAKNIDELNYYFTAIYLLVDTKRQTLEYINAGHCPALVIKKDKSIERLDSNSCPVGLIENTIINQDKIRIHDIDKILLYTDGLLQYINEGSINNALFQLEKMINDYSIKKEDLSIIEFVLSKLNNKNKVKDDICILETKFKY